jgi:hypothetical protein
VRPLENTGADAVTSLEDKGRQIARDGKRGGEADWACADDDDWKS